AEKKLVVVKNSGIFKSPKEEVKEFWLKTLENLPDFVLLLFDEQDVDKRSATYKAVAKKGLCVEFQYMKDYEIAAWVMREAQKQNKKISKENAEFLVSMCDAGLENIKNELDKLCDYSDSEIYKSDIEKVVSKPLNIVIFELTDALMRKDNDSAMSVILRLKNNKESAFNILYLLSSSFDKMLQAKLLIDDGYPYNTVSTKMKISPFIAKKYIESSKGFSLEFLIDRVCKTAEYDIAIKQGETDEWTALMQYVFESLN
ncbi:MAG: DNA polymerase III subunit delta, partial [Ruminococcaceae bacterium]|nr:DNA polymerase III subunit delta [Oscillospiraceae bacterium]